MDKSDNNGKEKGKKIAMNKVLVANGTVKVLDILKISHHMVFCQKGSVLSYILTKNHNYSNMIKGGEVDYDSYAKAMRGALSGPEICLPDNSLNHQYFNAKKGYYWSQDHDIKLADGIREFGADWKKIAQETFRQTKTEV